MTLAEQRMWSHLALRALDEPPRFLDRTLDGRELVLEANPVIDHRTVHTADSVERSRHVGEPVAVPQQQHVAEELLALRRQRWLWHYGRRRRTHDGERALLAVALRAGELAWTSRARH